MGSKVDLSLLQVCCVSLHENRSENSVPIQPWQNQIFISSRALTVEIECITNISKNKYCVETKRTSKK